MGLLLAYGAIALGACIIEKHFTTDKTLPGPDHSISADPKELSQLIRDIRLVESSLGDKSAISNRSDREVAKSFRRSIVSFP